MSARSERERATAAVYALMQREIDRARHDIFERTAVRLEAVNPRARTQSFCGKFDEAWKRSMLPNDKRSDGKAIEAGLL